jgi:putative peptide zinc metalloprotease protein
VTEGADVNTRIPKLRADLIQRTIEMGDDPMVVYKDPLSRTYHHFSQSEHELLCLADGCRSADEIAEQIRRQHPTALIPTSSVDHFFRQAIQQGLLQTSNPASAAASRTPRNLLWLLAVRLPGCNPTKVLETLAPIGRVLFSWPVAIASMIAIPVCLLIVLILFDQFAADFRTVTDNPFASLVWISLAIAIAKIVHELAHAMACRHLGCECRTIGVMLLFGIPCLYADVSDAWMQKRRSHRMLISIAGMYAESWIAVLATFTWMMSNPGPVHDVAVALMVVCSVSTILINGNPLLRYDGYYLLSDATGIANLAQRSQASLKARLQTLWGGPVSTADPIWMSVYAIASQIYRWMILISVAAIVARTLRSFDLGLIGILLFAFAVSIALIRMASSWQQLPTVRMIATTLVLVGVIALPIPQSVLAPMVIRPADSQEIYVREPGFLIKEPEFGKRLRRSDIISQLANPTLVRHHAAASANLDRIQTQIHTLQRSREVGSRPASAIPALRKDLAQAQSLVAFRAESLDRLSIKPVSLGTLFPPLPLAGSALTNASPIVHEAGIWLSEGTSLGLVGDDHRRDAVLYLSDKQVAKIQVGQAVFLMIRDAAKESVGGKVVAIDSSPCDQFPASLIETGLLMMPSEAVYRVRVQLDASGNDLTVHRVGRAKIETESESIAHHIYRLLSETFG